MKKLIFKILLLALLGNLSAQCVQVPISLNERLQNASLVVEGKVISINSFWNADNSMIYTANRFQISKIYKGSEKINVYTIDIITMGGKVGDKAITVHPELTLDVNQIGIAMLVKKDENWVAESGEQGFISIDKIDGTASDVFNKYPINTISNKISSILATNPVVINAALTKLNISHKRAAANITSFSPTTLTAGTNDTLTIKGNNFKASRDTSSVWFKNADNGGTSYVKAMQLDYISWSDTMIKVLVRSRAGTGFVRVLIGGNGTATSTDTLHITFNHLNVESGYKRDSLGYETRQVDLNGNGGITWKLSTRFADSTAAKGAFIRSLERWRCGTYINWDTLGEVKYNAIKSDKVNICAWDTSGAMPSGVLAQCFSYWAACWSGGGWKWYVKELDIRFRVKPTNTTNWNYTTGNATNKQFHFESVAVHEIGHGHQLGHVIAPKQVMHYAIANGQTKPALSSGDIAGGNYILSKSGTAICGYNKHSILNNGNCAFVNPVANFGISKSTVCLKENFLVTDSSKGSILSYSWNFGSGASPATASTMGPHTVQYTTSGSKTITLTITTTSNSTLTKTMNITVLADSKMIPNFTWSAAELGKVTFTNTSNGATSSKWLFGNGDSSNLLNPSTTFNSGGTKSIKLTATNTCNTEDTTINIQFAYLNFYVSPNTACVGQTVTYHDSSDLNVASYSWTFTGGNPASASTKGPHTVSYNSPGNKSATLTITATGGKSQTYTRTNIVNISTDTFSVADFNYQNQANNRIQFINNSTGSNLGYKWYFGDGDSSTLKNPLHIYTNANNKVVKLVNKGKCNTNEKTITLRDFTSVSNIDNANLFAIYPNPTKDVLYITSNIYKEAIITIIDANGKIVYLSNIGAKTDLNISQFTSGLYMIKIVADNYVQNTTLIIE